MEKVVPVRLESNIDEIIGKVERLNCVLREGIILMNELNGTEVEVKGQGTKILIGKFQEANQLMEKLAPTKLESEGEPVKNKEKAVEKLRQLLNENWDDREIGGEPIEPIRYNQGECIRDTAMNNLMQAHQRVTQYGTVKEIITLSKFMLKLSKQFNKEVLDFGLEKHI